MSRETRVDTRHRQVAQTVSHVMLDHMSSSGVMHGDGRRCGAEIVKHERKDITAVHARYCNITGISHSFEIRRASLALLRASLICLNRVVTLGVFASSSDKGNGGFVPNRSSCGVRVVRSWGHEL